MTRDTSSFTRARSVTQSEESYLDDVVKTFQLRVRAGDFSKTWKSIGKGTCGDIYKVQLKTTKAQVAAKQVKHQEYINEGYVLAKIKQSGGHPNLVDIIGAYEPDSNDTKKPLIGQLSNYLLLLPYMENGDVKSYLRDPKHHVTQRMVLTFCLELANAMDFLKKNNIIHRDIAARNCLLDGKLKLHLSDFGLSRRSNRKNESSTGPIYRMVHDRQLPLPWLAVETVEEGHFSLESDAWSLAVTIWELFSRCETTPYEKEGWEGMQIFENLEKGKRLKRPHTMSKKIYDMCMSLWHERPMNRPKPAAVSIKIQDVLDRPTYYGLKSLDHQIRTKSMTADSVIHIDYPRPEPLPGRRARQKCCYIIMAIVLTLMLLIVLLLLFKDNLLGPGDDIVPEDTTIVVGDLGGGKVKPEIQTVVTTIKPSMPANTTEDTSDNGSNFWSRIFGGGDPADSKPDVIPPLDDLTANVTATPTITETSPTSTVKSDKCTGWLCWLDDSKDSSGSGVADLSANETVTTTTLATTSTSEAILTETATVLDDTAVDDEDQGAGSGGDSVIGGFFDMWDAAAKDES